MRSVMFWWGPTMCVCGMRFPASSPEAVWWIGGRCLGLCMRQWRMDVSPLPKPSEYSPASSPRGLLPWGWKMHWNIRMLPAVYPPTPSGPSMCENRTRRYSTAAVNGNASRAARKCYCATSALRHAHRVKARRPNWNRCLRARMCWEIPALEC